MNKLSLVLAMTVAASGCQLVKQLQGGGSTAPSSPSSSSSAAAVEAPPVKSYDPAKPAPWCPAGYGPSPGDSNASWAGDGGRFTPDTLRQIARAACDRPADPERRKQMQAWREGFKKYYLATDDDFAAAMSLFVEESTSSSLKTAQCEAIGESKEESDLTKRAKRHAIAIALGCEDPPIVGDDLLYELDAESTTVIESTALASVCFGEDSLTGFAYCLHDARALDRGRFAAEIAALKPNLFGKVWSAMYFGRVAAETSASMAKVKALATKEADWRRMLAAHDEGWSSWVADRKANTKTLQAIAAFYDKADQGSKKAVAGCGATLIPLFYAHASSGKPATKDDVIARASDIVGEPLTLAMAHCAGLEGDPFARAFTDAFARRYERGVHGPRHAAIRAVETILKDILSDRPGFTPKQLGPAPSDDRMRKAAVDSAYAANSVSYSTEKGQISKLQATGDSVRVEFKTVRWREPTFACTPTRRIHSITPDGTLVYYENCRQTGSEPRSSTVEPVVIRKQYAGMLRPGQMLNTYVETRDGKRLGFPLEVYPDAKSTKLIGFMGVGLAPRRAK